MNFLYFCDSSCITLSFPFLASTFAFSFAEEIDMFTEFVEVENSRPFYILWLPYSSCAIKHNFRLPDLGLSLDLQKLLICE